MKVPTKEFEIVYCVFSELPACWDTLHACPGEGSGGGGPAPPAPTPLKHRQGRWDEAGRSIPLQDLYKGAPDVFASVNGRWS